MDDCRLEFASQLSADSSAHFQKVTELCLISLAHLMARVTQEKKMEHTQQNDQASMYQSNFRAEDGPTGSRWSSLYEGVVVPLASLFAVFLFMLGAMVIAN
jgi:hypothetical protein